MQAQAKRQEEVREIGRRGRVLSEGLAVGVASSFEIEVILRVDTHGFASSWQERKPSYEYIRNDIVTIRETALYSLHVTGGACRFGWLVGKGGSIERAKETKIGSSPARLGASAAIKKRMYHQINLLPFFQLLGSLCAAVSDIHTARNLILSSIQAHLDGKHPSHRTSPPPPS